MAMRRCEKSPRIDGIEASVMADNRRFYFPATIVKQPFGFVIRQIRHRANDAPRAIGEF